MQPIPPRSQPELPRKRQGMSRTGKLTSKLVPAPPPMQVVTKGWWVLRDDQKSVDELEMAERERR